jgi:hypothetical protein
MREPFIAGAFVSPFGKYRERNLRSLATQGVAGSSRLRVQRSTTSTPLARTSWTRDEET